METQLMPLTEGARINLSQGGRRKVDLVRIHTCNILLRGLGFRRREQGESTSTVVRSVPRLSRMTTSLKIIDNSPSAILGLPFLCEQGQT